MATATADTAPHASLSKPSRNWLRVFVTVSLTFAYTMFAPFDFLLATAR